jgi:hypothetical protein
LPVLVCRNRVPYIISPLSNIEMANGFSHR